ncbi:MAG TPA: FAD-dependent oxidoreductase [Polyangiaceae bacterium]|nr:FAD-dependent oxidoreductase [Polyangiaceae bacterium]
MNEVLVLGAGPAGLGAGLVLGKRALVLEQAEQAGGLSGSIEFEGAVFDFGGHSFHTPHPHVRRWLANTVEWYEQPRDARCFSHAQMIRYPFQKHFRDLDEAAVVNDCEEGLQKADAAPNSKNFGEFLDRRFGAGIGRHFMLPYNRKLWGKDLERLAPDWAAERVAAPAGAAEAFDEQGGKRTPLQDGTRVAYPARGGFGSIMTALARQLHDVRYRESVVSIDLKARTVTTRSGHEYSFERIVSTLPLQRLLRVCSSVPREIEQEVELLECLSLDVVLLVVGHPVDTAIQRVYCADDTVPAHKVALNHNSSPYLRALPRHGIMAEVSLANGRPSPRELIDWTIGGLVRMGILARADEVVATRIVSIPQAYPVPTHARDRIVAKVRGWLAEHGIYTVGRFGEWAYINSDEALHRGAALGARL